MRPQRARGSAYAATTHIIGARDTLGLTLVKQARAVIARMEANPNDNSLAFELGNIIDNINMISTIIDIFGKAE